MQQNNEYLGGFSRPAEVSIGDEHVQKLGDLGIAEAASPISSRPPATANFEDMMRVTAEAAGSSGGGATGNRWPRQETMALLRIRSEMDSVFRDASPKGPLWEQVSRKLAELGYKRNGKKCKEKFENVHKYYKRTKEGRTGRQDGKSYKFFTELEALHQTTPTAIATPSNPPPALPMISNNPPPIPVSLPPISLPPPIPQPQAQSIPSFVTQAVAPALHGLTGISFSSNSSSSSEGEEEEDEGDDHEDIEMESADTRKRKRPVHDINTDDRMMKFFEDLMRQVMQKQESMQQRFIEAIEKREQDRMIREEAWKRQDMARLNREHELMAQERAISASRDSAIITFLQKLTGQTIHFPTSQVYVNPHPPPPPTPVSAPPPSVQPPVFHHQPQQTQTQNFQQQQQIPENIPPRSQNAETSIVVHQPSNTSTEIVAVPEQIRSRDMTSGSASSRWPKTEVIALIQLRSGMESRYQEAGPKGPLWEEISAGMHRIGYNRNPKRCKEKWENINKYFKKVKESKKMRPEDAKTCPYFHELDALYRKKETSGIVIGGSGPAIIGNLPEQHVQQANVVSMSMQQDSRAITEGENQPEDIVRKQHQQINGHLAGKFCNSIEGSNSENHAMQNDDDMNYEEVDENEEYDDETEEDMKMAYKIQFQRQNVGSSNGNAPTSSTSFLAMVQ